MSFEEALREELSSISGLTNKVYPLKAKQGVEAPYLIYVSSEGVKTKSLQGYLPSKEVECELNIVSDSYSGLKNITKQVIAQIVSFQGRQIGSNGPVIQNVTYERPVELYENEVNRYRSVIDLTVRFKEV